MMLLGVACALWTGCRKEQPATPTAMVEGLRETLKRSAEQSLAAAPLAGEVVEVRAVASQVEPETARALKAAEAAGGAGVRSDLGGGVVSILATVPVNNVEAFKALVRHEEGVIEPPEKETVLVEVRIGGSAGGAGGSPAP